MKRYVFLLLTSTMFLVSACKKGKNCCVPPPQEYFLTATKADTAWYAIAAANYFNDSLYIQGNHDEEHIGFRIKFNGKGKYTINAANSWYYVTIGQDVLIDDYDATNATGNELDVTGYDEVNRIITGTFKATYARVGPGTPQPNQVAFTKGKFRVQLPK